MPYFLHGICNFSYVITLAHVVPIVIDVTPETVASRWAIFFISRKVANLTYSGRPFTGPPDVRRHIRYGRPGNPLDALWRGSCCPIGQAFMWLWLISPWVGSCMTRWSGGDSISYSL